MFEDNSTELIMVLLEHGAYHSDKLGWAKAMLRITRQTAKIYGVRAALRTARTELTKSRIAGQLLALGAASGRVAVTDYDPAQAKILVSATGWPNTRQRGVDGSAMLMGGSGREIMRLGRDLHVYNEPSIGTVAAAAAITDCVAVQTVARDVDSRFRKAAQQYPLAIPV